MLTFSSFDYFVRIQRTLRIAFHFILFFVFCARDQGLNFIWKGLFYYVAHAKYYVIRLFVSI